MRVRLIERWRDACMHTGSPSSNPSLPPANSPVEALLVGALVGFLWAAAVVWLGAIVSSLAAGHGLAPIRFGDAVAAIPDLIERPTDTAAAWPANVRSRIAGPVWFWPTVVIAAAVSGLGAVVGLCASRRWTTGRRRLGVDTHARFATQRELRPLLVRRPVPGRFVFGRWGNWLVATQNRRWAPAPERGWRRLWAHVCGERASGQSGDVTSIAICGPTRCGKTSQCAVPGLLDWVGPAVVLSVKRDLMDTTITRRRQLGQVRVFDPGGLLVSSEAATIKVDDGEVGRWSPLRTAHTATGAKKAGESLASWTPKAGVEGGMDFWATQGKLLFTGLLGAAALSDNPSMSDVARWVFDMTRPDPRKRCQPQQILEERYQDLDPVVRQAADSAIQHLNAIWNKPDERILASVYSTAQTVCDPWLDPNVAAATDLYARPVAGQRPTNAVTEGDAERAPEWIDLDWLMDTGDAGDRANTLYLMVSQDDYKRLAPVLAGLLSDLKTQVYEWDVQGRQMPAPLLMLIDEAGNIPLSWLPEVSSTCVGLGMQLVTIWQSLAQIHESYGKRADILLTNHATKLFFPGSSDDATLGYASKIVGDEEVERRSWSNDIGGGRRSISGQANREPLVPYFLTRLPRYGSALLIHSNIPPAHIQGREWWRTRRLAAMVPSTRSNRTQPRSGSGPWLATPPRPRHRPRWAPPDDQHSSPPESQAAETEAPVQGALFDTAHEVAR